MSRISDARMAELQAEYNRDEHGDFCPSPNEVSWLFADSRDARAEIVRLTKENARLDSVVSFEKRMRKSAYAHATDLEARLAAATTVTEQLVDVLKWARVYLMQHTTGTETLTDAALGALRAFVAFKQAGAGEGEKQERTYRDQLDPREPPSGGETFLTNPLVVAARKGGGE